MECGIATVWDGEVAGAGMAEGLASIPRNGIGRRILILADSKQPSQLLGRLARRRRLDRDS